MKEAFTCRAAPVVSIRECRARNLRKRGGRDVTSGHRGNRFRQGHCRNAGGRRSEVFNERLEGSRDGVRSLLGKVKEGVDRIGLQ